MLSIYLYPVHEYLGTLEVDDVMIVIRAFNSHKIIVGIIAIILFSLFSVNTFAAADDLQEKTSLLINKLSSVLPDQWRLEKVDNQEKKAWWMRYNESEFIKIRLVGFKRAGHRYKLQSGETKDVLYSNEAIYLWITPSSFDDGWTLWRRIRYHFQKAYVKLPDVIPTRFGLKIYVKPGWWAEKAPSVPPVLEARTIYEEGAKKGSWPDWKDDIAKAVK